jgi:lipopolysaccharide transport system ATP-binding protein
MKPIIRIQGLGKRYRIGAKPRYRTLRESVVKSATGMLAAARHLTSRNGTASGDEENNHIWALRDVSLDVMPGEVTGVIGRNGAGKSTLLKILSRITEPTTGRVDLYGRVGSLLEVGTGFHPELTGRENIYLSAAILGMRRAEIERKFDEIVAFAEVEKFIDTPVKRYSSGMYVRLAFAVAAHLEPEILLVDEVLAVGDVAFQKKCLGKMDEVARGGRTVFFVSHNTASIESLCTSALLLETGQVRLVGDPATAVNEYTKSVLTAASTRVDLRAHTGRKAGAQPVMTAVMLRSGREETSTFRMANPISFVLRFDAPRPIRPCFGLTVKTDRGFRIFHVSDRFCNQLAENAPVRDGVVVCEIPSLQLMPGRYVVDLWLEDFAAQAGLDMIADAISFEVVSADLLGTGRLPPSSEGPVFCNALWKFYRSTPEILPSEPTVFPDLVPDG